jgi:hypothetical protein
VGLSGEPVEFFRVGQHADLTCPRDFGPSIT